MGKTIPNNPRESQEAIEDLLRDLADEIDGIVDLGLTLCLVGEKKMAGLHDYVAQRCVAIRSIVPALASLDMQYDHTNGDPLAKLYENLQTACESLLVGFQSLEHYRDLDREALAASLAAVRTGWASSHQAIQDIATGARLLDMGWYKPIQERHDYYQLTLDSLAEEFRRNSVG